MESLEARLQVIAPPLALLLARLAVATSAGHALGRIFLSMLQHELGHAATAWLCGFGAFPGLWVTPHSDHRLPVLAVLLAAALGFGAWWSWQKEWRGAAVAFASVLVLQLILTLGLKDQAALALISFGGDAGCFVFGAALVGTFFVDSQSYLARTGLRWGFLVMGAFGFSDATATWWAARTLSGAIPYGEIEGVGLSDPSALTETFGWSERAMVNRYLAVAGICLLFLAIGYIRSVRRALRPEADPRGL